MPVNRFTQEALSELERLWHDYVKVEVIAKKLGRSVGVVCQKVLYLRLRRNPIITRYLDWTPPHLQREHIPQMGEKAWIEAARAWRKQEIADIHQKRHLPTQCYLLEMADEILPRTDITRNSKISILRGGGWKLQDLANIFGVTRQRINQISDLPKYYAYKAAHPNGPGRPRKDQTKGRRR